MSGLSVGARMLSAELKRRGLKLCPDCRRIKGQPAFARDNRSPGGRVAPCKTCQKARCRKYRGAN